MSKVKVKFYEPKKWAEHIPALPQFEITEKDEEKDISPELAEIVVGTGQGEYVLEDPPPKTPEQIQAEIEEDERKKEEAEKFRITEKEKKEKADAEIKKARELANQQARKKKR